MHLIISSSKRAQEDLKRRKLSGSVIAQRNYCRHSRSLPTQLWLMMISWPWPQSPLYHGTAVTNLHLSAKKLSHIVGAKPGIDLAPSSTRPESSSSVGRSLPISAANTAGSYLNEMWIVFLCIIAVERCQFETKLTSLPAKANERAIDDPGNGKFNPDAQPCFCRAFHARGFVFAVAN